MTGTCAICGLKLTPSGLCPDCDFDLETDDDEDEESDDEMNDDDIFELGTFSNEFSYIEDAEEEE